MFQTVLYSTVLHCTSLYCTVLHWNLQYCTVLPCSELQCTKSWCTGALDCTASTGVGYTTVYFTLSDQDNRIILVYCTLHTALCTLSTVHCALFTLYNTLHDEQLNNTVHCTVYTVHYAMHTKHCALHSLHNKQSMHQTKGTHHMSSHTARLQENLATINIGVWYQKQMWSRKFFLTNQGTKYWQVVSLTSLKVSFSQPSILSTSAWNIQAISCSTIMQHYHAEPAAALCSM